MPKTILVADDSVTIRKVVELTFHDTDIRVVSTGNGREALQRIAAAMPDLVLADVIMPEPSGYEICRAVKSSEHPVPVLLLAGAFEPFDPERAKECGADGHLVKPFESRSLLARALALLETPAPPAAAEAPRAADAEPVEALLDELAGDSGRGGTQASTSEPVSADETLGLLLGSALEPPPAPVAVAAPERRAAAADLAPGDVRLSPEELETVVRMVLERLSERVLREIAWKVVPDLAESIIRERIRQLEQAEPDKG